MRFGSIQIAVIDIVTFIGMLITLFTSILNLFQNKKSLYINNIIKCRLEAVEKIKIYVCELKMLSNTTNLNILSRTIKDKMDFRKELDKNIINIRLNLNYTRDIDKLIIEKTYKINTVINNYLYLYYLKDNIKYNENRSADFETFIKIMENINNKEFFSEIIKLSGKNFKGNKIELLNYIKLIYKNNMMLLSDILDQFDYIMINYENRLERLNEQLDDIVHIYIESKWMRCKREMKLWSVNKFNEDAEVEKLTRQFYNNK